MGTKGISKSTLQRLPVYLTYLKSLPEDGPVNISATAIAAALNMGEVQVRKDLASISGAGKPKVGYLIENLIDELQSFLGYDDMNDAIVVGAGKLGRALLDYKGFADYGLNMVAGFDLDPQKEGYTDTDKQIFHLSRLEDLCSRMSIRIAVITVPAPSAQAVCDLLVQNGVLAILNFAPTHLVVPEGVIVQNENIAASLAVLANRLKEQRT